MSNVTICIDGFPKADSVSTTDGLHHRAKLDLFAGVVSQSNPTTISGTTQEAIPQLVTAFIQAIGPLIDDIATRRIGQRLPGPAGRCDQEHKTMAIGKLCDLYEEHADAYYRRPSGLRTTEAVTTRYALRPLRRLFGRMRVDEFGPKRFKEVREKMIRRGWCRRQINQQMGRIKRMFKWGVEEELISASIYQALNAVPGLQAGRTDARESSPVKPVPEPMIQAVLPCASSEVAAMIQLQLLTGMRPGEVVIMRTCDIDSTQQPWLYRPAHHKTEHHQHERLVFLGPKAQEIIQPFLRPGRPLAFLFSPAKAEKARRRKLHAKRKIPLRYGNRPGTNRKEHPRKRPGERYDTQAYGHAIRYACWAAFPVPDGLTEKQAKQWRRDHCWHPHQLRHNAATRLRKDYGIDVAQVVLGHKTLAVTQVYAERDTAAAQKVMLAVG